MSWRNIWRNKVRSLVVIFAIAIGLVGGIFITGLMTGMVAQQTDNTINSDISNVQIHNPGFLENMNPKYLIDKVGDKVKEVESLAFVSEVCTRTKSTAMASTAATGSGVTIFGIDPAQEKSVTDIHTKLIEGHYFEKESKTAQIVIGQKLSNKLKAGVGKKIVITLQSLDGEMTYALFRVAGIFKTNDSRFDETNVFVRADNLNSSIGIGSDHANEIAIRTVNLDASFIVADHLKTEYPGLSVQSWRDIKPSLIIMMTMMDQFSYLLMIIILFALIFGIINTMLMVILERRRELGMLMAVGMNKKRVFKMILIETILLSLTGGAIGLVLSVALIQWLARVGINFASWAEGLSAMGYSSYIYPIVTTEFYVTVTILVIITAIIASIWPTRKAVKLNPAEAIRE